MGRTTPYIFIVDDDVDPFDVGEVFHAVVTKCHPYRGIVRLEKAVAGTLVPFLNEHERKFRIGGKAYFDCTWPVDWDPLYIPKKSSFANVYPAEVQQRALDKWGKYGYGSNSK